MSELEELKATIAKHCAEMRQTCFVAQDALLKSRRAAFITFDGVSHRGPVSPSNSFWASAAIAVPGTSSVMRFKFFSAASPRRP